MTLCVLSDDWDGPYVQVDGTAEVLDMPDALEGPVDYYRCIAGEHPDWDEYRAAMLRPEQAPDADHRRLLGSDRHRRLSRRTATRDPTSSQVRSVGEDAGKRWAPATSSTAKESASSSRSRSMPVSRPARRRRCSSHVGTYWTRRNTDGSAPSR